MAVVAEYRYPHLNMVVKIHDDYLESPEEQQERYDRVLAYEQRAFERAWLKAHGYGENGELLSVGE